MYLISIAIPEFNTDALHNVQCFIFHKMNIYKGVSHA